MTEHVGRLFCPYAVVYTLAKSKIKRLKKAYEIGLRSGRDPRNFGWSGRFLWANASRRRFGHILREQELWPRIGGSYSLFI